MLLLWILFIMIRSSWCLDLGYFHDTVSVCSGFVWKKEFVIHRWWTWYVVKYYIIVCYLFFSRPEHYHVFSRPWDLPVFIHC